MRPTFRGGTALDKPAAVKMKSVSCHSLASPSACPVQGTVLHVLKNKRFGWLVVSLLVHPVSCANLAQYAPTTNFFVPSSFPDLTSHLQLHLHLQLHFHLHLHLHLHVLLHLHLHLHVRTYTQRDTDTHTETHTDTHTRRHTQTTQTHTERHTQTHTDTHTDTHRHT